MRTLRRRSTAAILCAVAVAALAGCGRPAEQAPADQPATAAPTGYPLTLDNCGHALTFQRPPQRVVLLNGASVAEAESFVTLGLADRIVASSQHFGVSDQSGMAEAVNALPSAGLRRDDSAEFSREQILALHPDLVISTWAGGFDDRTGPIGRDALNRAGIPAFVTPSNCALGDPNASEAARRDLARQSVSSSDELLLTLGRIFDVQQRAADYVNAQRARIAAVTARVADRPRPTVLLVYPGMSAMNSNGLPAVFGGGIYDDIIAKAGGRNAFAGKTSDELAQINAEALASAPVDLVVIGRYRPDEDADRMASELFARFPAWPAARTHRYLTLSDSPYLGPLNATAVEKIADALAHPQ
ncbi:ABC transporter substrate-binding protein [Nocardia sp. CDC159]|uniref:ABC transporter substrate-binding protein n=1 Tax=Nocardia pulmonis TaxID=2951408 RepID=A0A9X2E6G3_9NOCA|nr:MULTISPECIES: ABC transporter substrate-binding protein [Nocardia]MCM6772501.1 ABC transporter substrate-binding protein [Nocardia pulmonis]MCM6784841.1 ABC transporter substrate-binding protein [Nocardia sp. CDC159]